MLSGQETREQPSVGISLRALAGKLQAPLAAVATSAFQLFVLAWSLQNWSYNLCGFDRQAP